MSKTVTITTRLTEEADAHDFADQYVSLIRATGGDVGDVVDVTYEVNEKPQPYRCTLLVEMPPDNGTNLRAEDIFEWLLDNGARGIECHDEDLIPADKRLTDD